MSHVCPDCGAKLVKPSRVSKFYCESPESECLVISVRYERGRSGSRPTRITRAVEAVNK